MRLTDHPGWSALAGGLLGAVAAAALAATGLLPSTASTAGRPAIPAPAVAPGSGLAGGVEGAFLAAWRAHLTASWSVDEIDERVTTAGAVVRFEIHRAQAPPDSVVIGNGTVAARRGSVELACGPGAGGKGLTCRSAPASLSWTLDVDRQIAALRAEVSGPRAVYAVVAAGTGCWSLVLKVPGAVVPVVSGRGATYCLDPSSGVLRSSVITRVGAVDRVTVVSFHAPATAADLALPAGAAVP